MSGAADGDEMVVMAAPARFVFGLLDKYLFSGEKMKTADAPSASTWWIDPVWVDQGPGTDHHVTPQRFTLGLVVVFFAALWLHRDAVDGAIAGAFDRLLGTDTGAALPPAVVGARRAAWWRGAWPAARWVVPQLVHCLHFMVWRADVVLAWHVGVSGLIAFRVATAITAVLWMGKSEAWLPALHNIGSVATPVIRGLFNVWPATSSAFVRLFMSKVIVWNLVLAQCTTESFSEFCCWRLAPFILARQLFRISNALDWPPAGSSFLRSTLQFPSRQAAICGSVDVPAIQQVSRYQIAHMGVGLCVAPVLHQYARARRRRFLFAPIADNVTDAGTADAGADARGEEATRRNNVIASTSITSAVLLLIVGGGDGLDHHMSAHRVILGLVVISLTALWLNRAAVDGAVEAVFDRLLGTDAAAAALPPAVVHARRKAWWARARPELWTLVLPQIVYCLFVCLNFFMAGWVAQSWHAGVIVFRLVVLVAGVQWMGDSSAWLPVLHRTMTMVIPTMRGLFGVWPTTSESFFRMFLVSGTMWNTALATCTTNSFSEFVCLRLGVITVAALCSMCAGVPAIRQCSSFQVAAMGAGLCVAPLVHQYVRARRRRFLFAPAGDATDADARTPALSSKEEEKKWRRMVVLLSTSVTSAVLLLLILIHPQHIVDSAQNTSLFGSVTSPVYESSARTTFS